MNNSTISKIKTCLSVTTMPFHHLLSTTLF